MTLGVTKACYNEASLLYVTQYHNKISAIFSRFIISPCKKPFSARFINPILAQNSKFLTNIR